MSQEDPSSKKYSVDVHITECSRVKNATAIFRQGAVHVKLPKRWNKTYKGEVTAELVRRVLRKEEAERNLVDRHANEDAPTLTLTTQAALNDYVRRLNAETFQVPLAKVQIGKARYTRLAQMNLRTRVMTVSQYCLNEVPESALRYLIIHELAHLLEAGHTKRFWALVAQFVPDYRKQSNLMKAYHRRAVAAHTPEEPPKTLELDKPVLQKTKATPPTRKLPSREASPMPRRIPVTPEEEAQESQPFPRIQEFISDIRQLFLF